MNTAFTILAHTSYHESPEPRALVTLDSSSLSTPISSMLPQDPCTGAGPSELRCYYTVVGKYEPEMSESEY